MLSSKEAKRIMPKAERKSRKWCNRHRFYELLASQAEQYIRKYDGRDAESIELNIFLRHSYGVFKEQYTGICRVSSVNGVWAGGQYAGNSHSARGSSRSGGYRLGYVNDTLGFRTV